MSTTNQGRLILVSNRLPLTFEYSNDKWHVQQSMGGLVTAIDPVLRDRGGIWIGWPGTTEDINLEELSPDSQEKIGYAIKGVSLSQQELDNFYFGFSNEIIWPLFHDLQTRCNFFRTEYWADYEAVNHKYAQVTADHYKPDDYIWVQDYQLMLVGRELRKAGVEASIGFFLHIPFPSPDIFLKLPWRRPILDALLQYDLIGFQTPRDRDNFARCARRLMEGTEVSGYGRLLTVQRGGKKVRAGAFPISIDFEEFARSAAQPEVEARIKVLEDERPLLADNRPLRQYLLGVDRLDYTKGIPFKLEALRHALLRHPELHEKITLIQIAVPSREDIPEYHRLKAEIERLVGEINGQFTKPGWVPIHYVFRSLDQTDLLAHYRSSDIALVTPLQDGMNLVAKEYCACNLDENGILILSEFAGAAPQLKEGALLVNPYSIEAVADCIYRAFKMKKEERTTRMRSLRRSVRESDIFWWVETFLKAARIDQNQRDEGPNERRPDGRGRPQQVEQLESDWSHFYAKQFKLLKE